MKTSVYVLAIAVAWFVTGGRLQAEPVSLPYKGISLVGEFVVAPNQQATDSVVLILHGTLAHLGMETIAGLQNVLTERGHNTLSINLGFGVNNRTGMYDCAIPHRHRYDDALGELAAWVNWLVARGIQDITLLGHSRGGAQAALFGAQPGQAQVKRLVLLAPALWDAEKAATAFEQNHGRPLAEALTEARTLAHAGKGNEVMKGIGLLYCRGADATADSFLSYYDPDPRFDTAALLPGIHRPVLVVAAGQDQVVPDVARKVRPLMHGDQRQLVVVEGAGHFFRDLYAEDVADAIDIFLGPES